MQSNVAEIENRILQDIHSRTGLSCPRLEGFDTTVKSVADAILPVLVTWVPIVPAPNMRTAIYSRFVTPYASSFLDLLLDWAQTEQDRVAVHTIIYAIGKAVQAPTANLVWQNLPRLRKTESYYHLLVKLSSFPDFATAARNLLVQELETGNLGFPELRPIADVNDSRIATWFETRIDDPDRSVRALARRIRNRATRLPSSLDYSETGPDRSTALFSTETDLHGLENLLKDMSQQLALDIPAPIRKGRFLSSLPLNRWTVSTVKGQTGGSASIYFRLEDIDTVEIVITRSLAKQESVN